MSYHLWVLIFPIVWATLQKEEQVSLAKPMISLLTKDFHGRQASWRVNVVQALLEGISLSQPQPKIPSELIKFLGKTYCAWHIAIPLLESHVMLFPNEPRCFDALAELYRILNEEDALFGLWRQRCGDHITRSGLALQQHGFAQEAQDAFFLAASRAVQNLATTISKAEMVLWETQWLSALRTLNRWDSIEEFAQNVQHTGLQLEAAMKLGDWKTLKEKLPQASTEDTFNTHLLKAYSSLREQSAQEADLSFNAALKNSMERWSRLPETGTAPAIPLLFAFQQLVEARGK